MIRAAVALTALALAACGGTALPDALPPSALPGMSVTERSLGPGELAQDAIAVEPARETLTALGLVGGLEREFAGHTAQFDHVVSRTLRFHDASGAVAYLGWLEAHVDDLLGDSKQAAPLALGTDGLSFTLVPCGSCKKELPTFLAAWRHDDEVAYLLAAGRGANPQTFRALAVLLDHAVTGT